MKHIAKYLLPIAISIRNWISDWIDALEIYADKEAMEAIDNFMDNKNLKEAIIKNTNLKRKYLRLKQYNDKLEKELDVLR